MPPRRSARAALALLLVLAAAALAAEPHLPAPTGLVVDDAGVLSPAGRARLTRLLEELRDKTGAEIAVVTVDTTAPLDDFTYAMRIAEAWAPGRGGEDTGIVFLVAVKDRRVRILVGYGLEGILPDGLVGAIQDEEVVPAFRAGRMEEGVTAGVEALAARIAAERGVTLEGGLRVRPRPPPAGGALPPWAIALVLLALLFLVLYAGTRAPHLRRGRRLGGPFGGFGGFGGGGGGFGGFGGGRFGGGGAGRSW